MLGAREAAFKALAAYRKNGAWSEIFLDNLAEKEEISQRDMALAENIVMGVISNLYYLDYYIGLYCATPLKKLHPALLDILRLSAYQIIFLEKIPVSAAVNEGVSLTKEFVNVKASGLANAVLRKISQNVKSLPEIESEDFSQYLSVKYSFPLWYVKEIQSYFDKEQCVSYFESCSKVPPVTIHANTLRITTQDFEAALENENIRYKKNAKIPGSYDISGAGKMSGLEIFKNGYAYVQDNSAYIAAIIAGAKKGDRVIDICSAPGGKSITSAMAMENCGYILSCDIHEKKLKRVRENAENLGIDIIETKCLDGRKRVDELLDGFDVVIADVPCSGFGVVGKKPEIRYKKDEETIGLCKTQLEILKNAANYAKPGGTVLYSTCTVLKRENEDIVRKFLTENHEFELMPFSYDGIIDGKDGMATFWPHINGFDGFFAAKLRRKL